MLRTAYSMNTQILLETMPSFDWSQGLLEFKREVDQVWSPEKQPLFRKNPHSRHFSSISHQVDFATRKVSHESNSS